MRTLPKLLLCLLGSTLGVESAHAIHPGPPPASLVGDPPPAPPKTLTLPDAHVPAGPDVGYLPATTEVTARGTYDIDIPLEVPAGRAGFAPELHLSYSSGLTANGPLGIGWSLSGTSAITRCGRDLARDGVVDGVDYGDYPSDSGDRFCLDGAELVQVAGDGYGAAGSEYRTEHDSFARITALGASDGAPTSFLVETREGRVRTYTAIAGTPQQQAGQDDVHAIGTTIDRWVLTKEADRSGNEIRYEWSAQVDPATLGLEVVIAKIAYTFDAVGNGGFREVRFAYEDRADEDFAWTAGVRHETRRRLASITMAAPNPTTTEPVWVYRLSYTTSASSGRSRLDSVERCGFGARPTMPTVGHGRGDDAVGACLWQKTFDWNDESPSFTTSVVAQYELPAPPLDLSDLENLPDLYGAWHPSVAHVGDFDGDGTDDLVLQIGDPEDPTVVLRRGVRAIDGSVSPLATETAIPQILIESARPVDVDGDGATELVATRRWDPDNDGDWDLQEWVYEFDTASGTLAPLFPITSVSEEEDSTGLTRMVFLDLDGDRLLDLVSAPPPGWYPSDYYDYVGKWFVRRNTQGFFDAPIVTDLSSRCTNAAVVDPDGDGRAELLTAIDDSATIEETGASIGEPAFGQSLCKLRRRILDIDGDIVAAPDFSPVVGRVDYGDFNGDGLADILKVTPLPDGVRASVAWNIGRGYAPAVDIDGFLPADVNDDWTLRQIISDVDGDGRDDILSLRRDPSGLGAAKMMLWTARSNGGFDQQELGNSGMYEEADAFTTTRTGDFDGDGRTDVVRVVGLDLELVMQDARFSDRIASMWDEGTNWPREAITYGTVTSDRREASLPASYPVRAMKRGMPVVREVVSNASVADDAFPTPHRLYYSYEDAVSDLHGRGFIGFRKFRTWDPVRPQEIVREYDNRTRVDGVYPKASLPVRTTTVTPLIGDLPSPTPGAPSTILGGVGPGPIPGLADRTRARVVVDDTNVELVHVQPGLTWDTQVTSETSRAWEQVVTIDWNKVDDPQNPTSEHIYGIVVPPTPARVTTGTMAYDAFGNPTIIATHTVGGLREVLQRTYDNRVGTWKLGLVTRETRTTTESDPSIAPLVNTTVFDYDNAGRLTAIHREPDSNDTSLVQDTTIVYDAVGNVIGKGITAAGPKVASSTRVTRTDYAPVFPGQPDERVFPNVTWVPGTVDASWLVIDPAFGVPLTTLDPNGVETRLRRDDLGRARGVERDGEAPTTLATTARPDQQGGINGLVQTTVHGAQVSTRSSDADGRTLRTTQLGFDGSVVSATIDYDVLGRVVRTSRPFTGASPSAFSTRVYDGLDRVLETRAPDDSFERQYHGFFERQVRDPVGRVSATLRDPDDRVTETRSFDAGQTLATLYAWSPSGVTDVVDPAGHETHIDYDRLSRVVSRTTPDAGQTKQWWTGFDELLMWTHVASNKTARLKRDGLGRVTERSDADGTTRFVWDTAAHGLGRLESATGPTGVETRYGYDDFGRSKVEELKLDGETHRIVKILDDQGRPWVTHYPSVDGTLKPGLSVVTSYNGFGAVESLVAQHPDGSLQQLWKVGARNADGALLDGMIGDDVAKDLRSYEPLSGRLANMSAKVGGLAVENLDYHYFADGRVKDRNSVLGGRSENLGYDGLGRLKRWTLVNANVSRVTEYAYDPSGNLERVSVDDNLVEANGYGMTNGAQPHTLTSRSGQGVAEYYGYDARGRLTSRPSGTITWTERDLPKTAVHDGQTWTFTYDAFGNRVKKVGPDGTTVYVGDIYERRGPSPAEAEHVFEVDGTDGPLAEIVYDAADQTRTTRWLLGEALGSIATVLDQAGNVLERKLYEPFGQRVQPNGMPWNNVASIVHDGFTGHEQDDDLGLVNMRGRMYDARLRRFLSTDPFVVRVDDGQSWNPYSYVRNDPMNAIDPSGWAEPVKQNDPTKCRTGFGICLAIELEPNAPGPKPPPPTSSAKDPYAYANDSSMHYEGSNFGDKASGTAELCQQATVTERRAKSSDMTGTSGGGDAQNSTQDDEATRVAYEVHMHFKALADHITKPKKNPWINPNGIFTLGASAQVGAGPAAGIAAGVYFDPANEQFGYYATGSAGVGAGASASIDMGVVVRRDANATAASTVGGTTASLSVSAGPASVAVSANGQGVSSVQGSVGVGGGSFLMVNETVAVPMSERANELAVAIMKGDANKVWDIAVQAYKESLFW